MHCFSVHYYFSRQKEVMFLVTRVCLSVFLWSARLLKDLWTDLDVILWRCDPCWAWPKD